MSVDQTEAQDRRRRAAESGLHLAQPVPLVVGVEEAQRLGDGGRRAARLYELKGSTAADAAFGFVVD